MSSYDLVIASAKVFHGEEYSTLFHEIAEFAEQSAGRVILGVNIESNPDDEDYPLTAYVMYEG